MLTIYSQVMVNVQFPVITYKKESGIQIIWFSLFKLFPVSFIQFSKHIFCNLFDY